jgi:flagellar hook assembly protein FlgD
LAESPGRTFSDIAVKVNQAEPGKVVVRVLDMSDLEVVPLYSGDLASGQWVFEWDGKLPDGRKASPGIYQVEVRSGAYMNRKNIRVR